MLKSALHNAAATANVTGDAICAAMSGSASQVVDCLLA
jgi:hypothetical protein